MESSVGKAAGTLEGAVRYSQEDSTSKRNSRKKAQGQNRRRLGEYSKQRSDARALSSIIIITIIKLNTAAAIG